MGEKANADGLLPKTNAFAEEGILAHEIAEYYADAVLKGASDFKIPKNKYTEEMVRGAKIYAEYLRELYRHTNSRLRFRYGLEDKLYIEKTPEVFGTCDAWVIRDKELFIVDYKFGRYAAVSPEENSQLKCYALGVLNKLDSSGLGNCKITLVIVQPRVEIAIKEWVTSKKGLISWEKEVLKPAVANAKSSSPALKTGDHCKYCPGISICGEMNQIIKREEYLSIFSLSVTQLSEVLNKKQLIIKWLDEIEKRALHLMQNGASIPGFAVGNKRKVRKLKKLSEQEQKELELLIGDGAHDIKLKSVSQLEKMLGKDKHLLEKYITFSPTESKVIKKDINLNEIFGE